MDIVSFFFVGSRAGLGGEDCQTLRPVFRVRAGAGRESEAQLHALKGQRIVGGRSVRGRAVRRALGCGSFRSGGLFGGGGLYGTGDQSKEQNDRKKHCNDLFHACSFLSDVKMAAPGFRSAAISAGSVQFWHVWGWLVS